MGPQHPVKALCAGENGLRDVETTEEGQVASRPSAVWKPPKAEVIEHNLTHIPFRNWCRYCVRGRAVNGTHPHTCGGEGGIPVISVDYFWMTEDNVDPECQEENEREMILNRTSGGRVKGVARPF